MKKLFLTILFVYVMLFCLTEKPALAADYPEPAAGIAKEGQNQVYMAWYNGNWDIFMKDANTGSITKITDDPNVQAFPDVWGKHVVWQDNRNNPDKETGSYHIYLYDAETKNATQISQTPGNHQEPLVTGNKVVWTDHALGKKDIYLYDISTGSQKKITSNGSQAFGIKFDGEDVAWVDFRNGGKDLYVYDLNQQQETQGTSGKDVYMALVANDGKVAWAEKDQGTYQVKVLDSTTNNILSLTSGNNNSIPLAMSGSNLLLARDGYLNLMDMDTKKEFPLQLSTANPEKVALQGDQIVWVEGGKTFSEPVSAAIARVQTSQGGGLQASTKTVLVPAQQQVSISSPDGQAVFTIEPGTFNKDCELTLIQEAYQVPGYTAVTSGYSLDVKETLQKPVRVAITCRLSEGENKKTALYQKQGDSWQRLTYTRKTENALESALINPIPVALFIKQVSLKDMDNHWGKQDVEILASHGIINGYSDNTFKPERPITRAEFVAILANSNPNNRTNHQTGNNFSDVPSSHWAASAIQLAREKGWVGGYPGNKFLPDQTITREEMMAILIRYSGLVQKEEGDYLKDFADFGNISPWAEEALSIAVGQGLIKGYQKQLRPGNRTTRAEAAVILYRLLQQQNGI